MFIEPLTSVESPPSLKKEDIIRCLQIQWGWITPGTTFSHRKAQSSAHLQALKNPVSEATEHLLFLHCGWWLDNGIKGAAKNITHKSPEPRRAQSPASRSYLRELTKNVQAGRLEYIAYPYAACVTEATSFEGLLRSFRLTRDLAKGIFGINPRIYMVHDGVYGLDWGTPQVPHLVNLLGGGFLVSGKNGTLVAPDGTEIQTFGYERSIYEIAKNPCALQQASVFCSEMHEHIRHMNKFSASEHFLTRALDVKIQAITLEDYLEDGPARDERHLSAAIGSKSWYGGIMDALLIEQMVKSVELRLPALEALLLMGQSGLSPKQEKQIADLWKRSFILMDNQFLWQCHDFKSHLLPCAKDLAADCEVLETTALGGGKKSKHDFFFNAVPWTRAFVERGEKEDVLHTRLPGWSATNGPATMRFPANGKNASSPHLLENESIRYELGPDGNIEAITRSGGSPQKVKWGSLLRLREIKSDLVLPLKANDPLVPYTGCASLTAEIDLTDERCFEGFLELGKIQGDAYLLKVERLDLTGKVFSENWHELRSLHWIGIGLPQHQSEPPPIFIKMCYAARLRLTVWLASEKFIGIEPARIRLSHQSKLYLDVTEWELQGITEWKFENPEVTDARVVRESEIAKEVCFSGRLEEGRFELHALLEAGSPRLDYRLDLHFDKPTSLGVSTPPFDEKEGSLFGAGCERPYMPGLMVVSEHGSNASYFVDKPSYIQQALDAPESTWHTDRRNWWLGISPFIGMNMAVANWDAESLGMFTRGIKHFFRWQREDTEMLGLSLGCTWTHVCTQAHSVAPESRFFHLTGRIEHDPYFETPFLKAANDYHFDYAFRPRMQDDREDCLDFWKSAQEFALPVQKIQGTKEIPGVFSDHASIILTGLERRDGGYSLRMINLSSKPAEGTVSLPLPFHAAMMDGETLPAGNTENSFHVTLPAWAVREIHLQT